MFLSTDNMGQVTGVDVKDYLKNSRFVPMGLKNVCDAYNNGLICKETFPIEKIAAFYEYCDSFYSAQYMATDQTRASYSLSTMVLYTLLNEEQKSFWYEFVVRDYYGMLHQVSDINYTITMDNIFTPSYLFMPLESYLMMFDLLRYRIENNKSGYKSKKVKELVIDFGNKMRPEYSEAYKEYVVKTLGKDGKKYLMEASLGGK